MEGAQSPVADATPHTAGTDGGMWQFHLARGGAAQQPHRLTPLEPKTPSLSPLFLFGFWGVPVPGGGSGREGCVWGCKECESTKSHAVKVVCLCEE
jgi:hypothetical protein